MPCCARIKAVLGVPCCAQWGRAAAHHNVALGVLLMAPPAFTMMLDMGWGPRVESGQGKELSSSGGQPGEGSSGRTPGEQL